MAESSTRNTTRHREAGAASRAETCRRLLHAAGEEFTERGYHAATVSRISKRAGVTVQTLYLAWGSKRALLRGHVDASLAGDPDEPYADALPHLIDNLVTRAGGDSRAIVTEVAHFYRNLAERSALSWQLYRDAAATDPEVADDWRTLQHLRHDTFAAIIDHIDAAALRPELTTETAVDTAWAIASPETYDLLINLAGYSLDDYEQWVATTLAAALLR